MGTLNKRYMERGHGRGVGEKSPGPQADVSGNAGGLERDVVEARAGSRPEPGDAASDPRHHACPRGSGEAMEGLLRAARRGLASEVGRVAVARPALRLPQLNRRQRTLLGTFLLGAVVALVIASSFVMSDSRLATDLDARDIPPSLGHPFGTDWLGRDMLVRTVKGLTLSLGVGVFASVFSVAIALALGLLAASGVKAADAVVSWLVDFFLGLPHLVFLILIAFVLGGGVFAVVVGVALTHWPSLARVVRAEVLQLRTAEYIQASPHFGRSRWWMARKHFLPHLVPQLTGRASRSPIPIYDDDLHIGQVTSHTFSPMLKKYIGIASVRTPYAVYGRRVQVEFTVEHMRLKAEAEIVRLPFFNPPRKRA